MDINYCVLIQRIINKALKIESKENVIVVTDSEEISLISERREIRFLYDNKFKLKYEGIFDSLAKIFSSYAGGYETVIVMWPYAPLVTSDEILKAYDQFEEKAFEGLASVKNTRHEYILNGSSGLKIAQCEEKKYFVEVKAFIMFRIQTLINKDSINWQPYVLEKDRMEIKDYHDWWVCEKLLKRKRIIFRVIGNMEVGMGHIYRAITLAHENTDHELIFVCDKRSEIAINKIAGHEYCLEIADINEIEERIVSLKPDLVINDILDTDKDYVERLKMRGIKVVNFEDLGTGSKYSDLTFNELYDEPLFDGKNIRWGHQYSFLREEFVNASQHKFFEAVEDILVTFGGSDSPNLTQTILEIIVPFCNEKNINIHVVVGSGYAHRTLLARFIKDIDCKNILVTSRTGIMSSIMERTPIAISSNGRTVYELAHMRIPAIVVAQHAREDTHLFAQEKNGFINVGVFEKGKTEKQIVVALEKLYVDTLYRKSLFDNMNLLDFVPNKKRVINEILNLFNDEN